MRAKLYLTLAAIGIACFFVMRYELYLPVQVMLDYAPPRPNAKVYVDTGGGFNEAESFALRNRTRFAKYRLSSSPYFGAPIVGLRIDPARILRIHRLCIGNYIRSECWHGEKLAQKLVPQNDIRSAVVNDDTFDVTASGPDPYLILRDGIEQTYDSLAKVPLPAALALAILLPALTVWLTPVVVTACGALGKRLIALEFRMSLNEGLAVFVILGLLLPGTWVFLDKLGPWVWGSLWLFVLILAFYRGDKEMCLPLTRSGLRRIADRTQGDGAVTGVLAGAIILLPAVSLLILTWDQEFPYLGDQHFHMEIDRYTYFFVRDHLTDFLVILAGFIVFGLLGRVRYWAVLVMGYLILSAHFDNTPGFVVRFPGTGRFLVTPFMHFAETWRWDSLLNAVRLGNAAGIVLWLWVLRPLVVGRWPDLSILPVAAAFFFQTDVVYYFTSGYLEPWSLIFILLALEYQILNHHKHDGYLIPLLFIGLAAITKEYAAVMLPVVWLAARPWRFGVRNLVQSMVAGVAAGAPFLIYYALRVDLGEYDYMSHGLDQLITVGKVVEIVNRWNFHFGVSGGVLLALLAAGILVSIPYLRDKKALGFLLLGALASQFLFFNLEIGSISDAGYVRYYLHMFLFLCCSIFLLYQAWPGLRHNKMFVASITVLVIVLNGEKLVPYMSKTFGSDAARNFTEHYTAPIFLPIRHLIEAAEDAGKLQIRHIIRINNPLNWDMPSIGIDYPGLAARYRLRVEKNVPCRCEEPDEAILASFVYYSGLNAHILDPSLRQDHQRLPREAYLTSWNEINGTRMSCLNELKTTCGFVRAHRVNDAIVGIIGVY